MVGYQPLVQAPQAPQPQPARRAGHRDPRVRSARASAARSDEALRSRAAERSSVRLVAPRDRAHAPHRARGDRRSAEAAARAHRVDAPAVLVHDARPHRLGAGPAVRRDPVQPLRVRHAHARYRAGHHARRAARALRAVPRRSGSRSPARGRPRRRVLGEGARRTSSTRSSTRSPKATPPSARRSTARPIEIENLAERAAQNQMNRIEAQGDGALDRRRRARQVEGALAVRARRADARRAASAVRHPARGLERALRRRARRGLPRLGRQSRRAARARVAPQVVGRPRGRRDASASPCSSVRRSSSACAQRVAGPGQPSASSPRRSRTRCSAARRSSSC